ncbi:MAG: lipoprotein [Pseudomonadales bacterium]|nr:lipoprotein [Pseudomonadales bacterium]
MKTGFFSTRKQLLLLALLLALAACGQKGPLVRPGSQSAAAPCTLEPLPAVKTIA